MQVIVIGMHRCGTSLLSSILLDLSVHIGENLLMRGKMQPHGHWEDRDFLSLNRNILRAAGGRWNVPPSRRKILQVRGEFNERIKNLVAKKSERKKWGWKDPRTSLTIPLYHPYLVSPRYVRIIREKSAVIQSLQRRHKGGHKWGELYDEYVERADAFLSGKPHLVVTYRGLVEDSKREIERVNEWISGNGRIKVAMKRVKHD